MSSEVDIILWRRRPELRTGVNEYERLILRLQVNMNDHIGSAIRMAGYIAEFQRYRRQVPTLPEDVVGYQVALRTGRLASRKFNDDGLAIEVDRDKMALMLRTISTMTDHRVCLICTRIPVA